MEEIDCNTYQCPHETHYQPTDITGECYSSIDDDCLNKCCRPYTVCGQWSQYGNNKCEDNSLPYISRTIPPEGKDRLNLSIENICCNDIKCSDYTCPAGFKVKEGVSSDKLAYRCRDENICDDESCCPESGDDCDNCDPSWKSVDTIYDPIGQCCSPKSCLDWKNDGYGCGEYFPEYDNASERPGYSINECCFRSCDRWAIDPSSGNEPCGFNILLRNKHGWGESECCLEKNNTCANKTWTCPENSSIVLENIDTECEGSLSTCPKNDRNIELCCSPYNKCSNITCPANYHLNYENKDKSCLKRVCNIKDDLELCCEKNETCSNLQCGKGLSVPPHKKDKYCLNKKCSLKHDKDTCCSENNTCSSLECPTGYYMREGSDEKTCYGEVCDPENRFDFIRCCRECPQIENATEIVCTNKEDVIATDCQIGYILEDGLCSKDINTIKVKINIDIKYSKFVLIDDYERLLINDLCSILNKDKGINILECIDYIEIKNIKKHLIGEKEYTQVLINIDSILEGIDGDISSLFKNRNLSSLTLNITDSIKIKDSDEHTTCSVGIYKYQCPFYMSLKDDSNEIYGSTDLECCKLDWNVLKYVFPIFLFILLILYIIYKVKLGRRR